MHTQPNMPRSRLRPRQEPLRMADGVSDGLLTQGEGIRDGGSRLLGRGIVLVSVRGVGALTGWEWARRANVGSCLRAGVPRGGRSAPPPPKYKAPCPLKCAASLCKKL